MKLDHHLHKQPCNCLSCDDTMKIREVLQALHQSQCNPELAFWLIEWFNRIINHQAELHAKIAELEAEKK